MTKIALDAAFTPTSRTLTSEGYLCVKGIAARTGVYQYLSTELGLPGPVREVNVYRPPSEVFSPESLASYPDSDVTNDHPEDLVSAITYRDHSVGHVRGAMQDGEDVVVDMIIKDQSAIDAIQSGKSELSPGYLAEYVPVNGYAPDGTNYEFEQRDIVINHVAVVEAARAGNRARIFDSKPKGDVTMAQRKVFLDSKKTRSVTLDEEAAAVVEQAVSALEDVAEEAKKRADEAEAKADDLEEKLEAMSEEKEKMTSDSAISTRVAGVLSTINAAKKLQPSFDSGSMTNPLEIKRAVMASLKPTRDWASKSADYVNACFDAASDDKDEEDEDDDKDGKGKMSKDARATLDSIAKDFGVVPGVTFRDAQSTKTSDTNQAYKDWLQPHKKEAK